MKKSKAAALVAGALVLGLTVGTLGVANAATRHTPRSTHATAAQMKALKAASRGLSPVATLAKLTGLSVADIMKLHAQGESFAQIATDNGVDPQAVVAQVVAARQVHLDALVAAGKLTAAQEQAILTRITQMVTTMVGRTPGTGMTTGTVDPTGTMTPGTPAGTGTMVPGSGYGTGTMTPGSGMTSGSAAPHSGPGMM